jgi:hypothetical protein
MYPWAPTVLADNLESGDFRNWSRVVRNGDAQAYVTGSRAWSGACSGRLVVTSRWDSRANVQKHLGSSIDEVWAQGYFYVAKEGSWGSNVPIWRFFNGSQRIIDLHRQNGTGDLWIRRWNPSGGWWYSKLDKRLSLNRWYQVKMYVRSWWGGSKVAVWVDGTVLYYKWPYVASGRITTAMVGAEHVRQVMDLSFDHLVIEAR